MTTDTRDFPRRLRRLLRERGMRQSDLATAMGVGEPVISHYVHGTRCPRLASLYLLRDVFECSWEELLG